MTKKEYELRRENLFTRWKEARSEYTNETEGKRFSLDGIQNFDSWMSSKPKILFLLKENRATEDDWEPCWGIKRDANPFSWNIIRWRQILMDLYNKSPKEPTFLKEDLPEHVNDIAIIEVKKLNEGKGKSNYFDIRDYARDDKKFIKEQIELINPDIVFCCYTGDNYESDIYGDEPWVHLIADSKCNCYSHRNRLVIDFYHPSVIGGEVKEKELFHILYRMLSDGRIFENFNWS